jgi:formylglycine-generating enzyme required for sulfatase activity
MILISKAVSKEVFGDDAFHSFYICSHEVTQAEFRAVTGYNPSEFKGGNRPVESVSWFEAIQYCNKLSIREGLTPYYVIDEENYVRRNFEANGYRLPTVTQWLYAARGGESGRKHLYSGSNDINEVAWYQANSDKKTHKVKSKAPNELGLYDMSGNVNEWCWNSWNEENDNYYDDFYYDETNQCYCEKEFDPIDFRVSLGGNWSTKVSDEYNACQVRNVGFDGSYPDDSFNWCGFRVVLPAAEGGDTGGPLTEKKRIKKI